MVEYRNTKEEIKMGEIIITIEEYKNLLETSVRADAFIKFVKCSKYNIDREDCGRYLGFDVGNLDGDD